MNYTPHEAFTIEYKALANVIRTGIGVSQVDETNQLQTEAIWDTGATNCAMTKAFIGQLGLSPIGKTIVKGVHGDKEVNVYLIDLYLPNRVKFKAVRVTECEELSPDGNCAMLIGMNVMRHGDLAISNYDKKTVFTFRIPSQKKIDFVANVKTEQVRQKHLGRTQEQKFTPPKKKKKKK